MKASIVFRFSDKPNGFARSIAEYKFKPHLAMIDPNTNEVLSVFCMTYNGDREDDYEAVLMTDVKKFFIAEPLHKQDGDFGFMYKRPDKKVYWSPLPIKLLPVFKEYRESFKEEIQKPSDIFRMLSL